MADENKVLKDAQFRKNAFIAFFNANNAAVEMVKLEGVFTAPLKGKSKVKKVVPLTERLKVYRDESLAEYKKYCAEVISGFGTNYKPDDSIARLKLVKTKAELKDIWLTFSEDERRDPAIKAVAKELKDKFKNGTN